jgi:hypothetical protein
MTKALEDVVAERKRQVEEEGWTDIHDDQRAAGELAKAAVAYASNAFVLLSLSHRLDLSTIPSAYTTCSPPSYWPWSWAWWKPKNPRRDLVRAAALILAEIERLDRRGFSQPQPE